MATRAWAMVHPPSRHSDVCSRRPDDGAGGTGPRLVVPRYALLSSALLRMSDRGLLSVAAIGAWRARPLPVLTLERQQGAPCALCRFLPNVRIVEVYIHGTETL